MSQTVDARKAKPGDEVTAMLTDDVRANGRLLLLRGTMLVGRVTEAQARTRVGDGSTDSRLGIAFERAVLRDGQELTIPSSQVQVDEIVVLKPGDKVPVDGEVTEGETSIDEALVTGESVPVTKRPGDGVIAGSINRSGSVRFRDANSRKAAK